MLRSSTPRPISAKVTCGPIVARQWLFGKRGSGSSGWPRAVMVRRGGWPEWVRAPPVPRGPSGSNTYGWAVPPGGRAFLRPGGVALAAFGLALVANVHWVLAETRGQRPPLLAL